MGSQVSIKQTGASSNAKGMNNCTFGFNTKLPSEGKAQPTYSSNILVTFNETQKKDIKLLPKNFCCKGKLICQVKVKIALANCRNTLTSTICEFNSTQIISLDNKKIDCNGSVLIKPNVTINLKTLTFTNNSEYLAKLVPVTVKLVNCSLKKIETPTSDTTTTQTSNATTTTTTNTTTTPNTTTAPGKVESTSTTSTSTRTKPTVTNVTNTTTAEATTTTTATANTTTTKSKSSNGKIALVILAIFILLGVAIITCYYKYRKKLSNRPAYYNDISLNDPLHTEIKFYKADGEDAEDGAEDDDDDILPLI